MASGSRNFSKPSSVQGFDSSDISNKMQSSTLKRQPSPDWSKTDLLRLLSYFEGELQARDVTIAALKAEKAKQLLYQAKYGRFGLGDPFVALQRDAEGKNDSGFDEAAIKSMYDNQLAQLENLIATQRKAQLKMREQLGSSEKRFHKVCTELEDEKQKHAQDTAQGDDVTYMLEKERERLKAEIDFEKSQNKKLEKDLKKTLASLEDERANASRHKQVAIMLIKERKKLIEDIIAENQLRDEVEIALSDEKSRTINMAEGLEKESKRSLKMEVAMEKQNSQFDSERESLRLRLHEEEIHTNNLRMEVGRLSKQLEGLQQQMRNSSMSPSSIQMRSSTSPVRVINPSSSSSPMTGKNQASAGGQMTSVAGAPPIGQGQSVVSSSFINPYNPQQQPTAAAVGMSSAMKGSTTTTMTAGSAYHHHHHLGPPGSASSGIRPGLRSSTKVVDGGRIGSSSPEREVIFRPDPSSLSHHQQQHQLGLGAGVARRPGPAGNVRIGPVGAPEGGRAAGLVEVDVVGSSPGDKVIRVSPGSSATVTTHGAGGKISFHVSGGVGGVSPAAPSHGNQPSLRKSGQGQGSPMVVVPGGGGGPIARGVPPPIPPNKPNLVAPSAGGGKPSPPPKGSSLLSQAAAAQGKDGIGQSSYSGQRGGVQIPVNYVGSVSSSASSQLPGAQPVPKNVVASVRTQVRDTSPSAVRKNSQCVVDCPRSEVDSAAASCSSPLTTTTTNPPPSSTFVTASSPPTTITNLPPATPAMEFLDPEMANLHQLLASMTTDETCESHSSVTTAPVGADHSVPSAPATIIHPSSSSSSPSLPSSFATPPPSNSSSVTSPSFQVPATKNSSKSLTININDKPPPVSILKPSRPERRDGSVNSPSPSAATTNFTTLPPSPTQIIPPNSIPPLVGKTSPQSPFNDLSFSSSPNQLSPASVTKSNNRNNNNNNNNIVEADKNTPNSKLPIPKNAPTLHSKARTDAHSKSQPNLAKAPSSSQPQSNRPQQLNLASKFTRTSASVTSTKTSSDDNEIIPNPATATTNYSSPTTANLNANHKNSGGSNARIRMDSSSQPSPETGSTASNPCPPHTTTTTANSSPSSSSTSGTGITPTASPKDLVTAKFPLHKLAADGDLQGLQLLLSSDKKLDVNLILTDGSTPLHLAVENNREACVKHLLENGARPSCLREDRITPLHMAVSKGYTGCTRLLLNKGAAVNLSAVQSQTPLHLAVKKGHLECCQMLLRHGAYVFHKGQDNLTVIHYATQSNQPQMLQALLDRLKLNGTHRDSDEAHQLVAVVDDRGWSLAHMAASLPNQDCLIKLAESLPLDFNCKDKEGSSVREVASAKCQHLLVDFDRPSSAVIKVEVELHYFLAHSFVSSAQLGGLDLSPGISWQAMEGRLHAVLKSYLAQLDVGLRTRRISRLDSDMNWMDKDFTLGLAMSNIKHFEMGYYKWTPGMQTDTSPYLILCNNEQKKVTLVVDDSANICDLIAFDVLHPVFSITNYIRLMEQYKSIIFYGPTGSGKSYLANRLAQCIAAQENGMGRKPAIYQLSLQTGFTAANFLTYLKQRDCVLSVNKDASSHVPILVLDNLELVDIAELFGELLDPMEYRGIGHAFCLRGNADGENGMHYLHHNFYVIGTMNKSKSLGVDLSVLPRFRWIQFRLDTEPLRGLLARHFLRRILNAHQGCLPPPDDPVFRATEWVVCVWQRLNDSLVKLGLPEVVVGPCLLFKCPLESKDVSQILEWVKTLWNEHISPKVREAVKRGTGSEAPSDGQQKVANTALYVLMQRSIILSCPLTGHEKESYLAKFSGSNELDIPLKPGDSRAKATAAGSKSANFLQQRKAVGTSEHSATPGRFSKQKSVSGVSHQSSSSKERNGRDEQKSASAFGPSNIKRRSLSESSVNKAGRLEEHEDLSPTSITTAATLSQAKVAKLEVKSSKLLNIPSSFRSYGQQGDNRGPNMPVKTQAADPSSAPIKKGGRISPLLSLLSSKSSSPSISPKKSRSSENISSTTDLYGGMSRGGRSTPQSPFSFSLATPTSNLSSFKFLESPTSGADSPMSPLLSQMPDFSIFNKVPTPTDELPPGGKFVFMEMSRSSAGSHLAERRKGKGNDEEEVWSRRTDAFTPPSSHRHREKRTHKL